MVIREVINNLLRSMTVIPSCTGEKLLKSSAKKIASYASLCKNLNTIIKFLITRVKFKILYSQVLYIYTCVFDNDCTYLSWISKLGIDNKK